MSNKIISFFDRNLKQGIDNDGKVLELAVTALLVEMMRMDDEVTTAEHQAVFDTLKTQFDLGAKDAEELITLAEFELDFSHDCTRFSGLINEHFSYADKMKMILLLWRIAYSDKQLHRDEAYFVQEIANLLDITQNDFDICRNQVRDEVL